MKKIPGGDSCRTRKGTASAANSQRQTSRRQRRMESVVWDQTRGIGGSPFAVAGRIRAASNQVNTGFRTRAEAMYSAGRATDWAQTAPQPAFTQLTGILSQGQSPAILPAQSVIVIACSFPRTPASGEQAIARAIRTEKTILIMQYQSRPPGKSTQTASKLLDRYSRLKKPPPRTSRRPTAQASRLLPNQARDRQSRRQQSSFSLPSF